jgi:glucose/arabinose dehydrogenase
MFISPVGLAFQPGTEVLYVSTRLTATAGGALWRIPYPGAAAEPVITDLPCCYNSIDNQPNGMVFGPDGLLYLGIGAVTDHAESSNADVAPFAEIDPLEAAIVRVNPHTGTVAVFGRGLRNPYDLSFDSRGQFYASDSGLVTGPGDRVLRVEAGGHYGWPYWRLRGCADCPPTDFRLEIAPDLVTLPDYSLPRGMIVYKGTQFPTNVFDSLFIVLWNGTENAQRVVRIDPQDTRLDDEEYAPEPFVTGLIRPVDVTIAPDGSLVVADFVYGHVWRVRYVNQLPVALATGENNPTAPPVSFETATPQP